MTARYLLFSCLLACSAVWTDRTAVADEVETAIEDTANTDPTLKKLYDLELGKRIFSGKCLACHGEQESGAPQYGDMESWQDRIAQGQDRLIEHALNGHGRMPPKGGLDSLSDTEVSAAVAFVYDRSRRMLSNRRLNQSVCTDDDIGCDHQDSEEAMILHMLWLLGGGGKTN